MKKIRATEDIKIELGINKCKTLHMERRIWYEEKINKKRNKEYNYDMTEIYKYLGFWQNTQIYGNKTKNYTKHIENWWKLA